MDDSFTYPKNLSLYLALPIEKNELLTSMYIMFTVKLSRVSKNSHKNTDHIEAANFGIFTLSFITQSPSLENSINVLKVKYFILLENQMRNSNQPASVRRHKSCRL